MQQTLESKAGADPGGPLRQHPARKRGWPRHSALEGWEGGDESNSFASGDDAADALRYLVATKSREVAQRKLRGL